MKSLSLAHLTSLKRLTLLNGAGLALNKGLVRGLSYCNYLLEDVEDGPPVCLAGLCCSESLV